MSEADGETCPTANRILDAALSVLAREGIAGVSMRAVAREADVAVGLANYHFKNKTELVAAARAARDRSEGLGPRRSSPHAL